LRKPKKQGKDWMKDYLKNTETKAGMKKSREKKV
jgi:hypothetical protein